MARPVVIITSSEPLDVAKKAEVPIDFTTRTEQTSSLLLTLPAELRNRIFELAASTTTITWKKRAALSPDTRADPIKAGEKAPEIFDGKPSAPGYILCCKQVYLDSIEVLYANATFSFETRDSLRNWNGQIEKGKLDLVKEIEVTDYVVLVPRRPPYFYTEKRTISDFRQVCLVNVLRL